MPLLGSLTVHAVLFALMWVHVATDARGVGEPDVPRVLLTSLPPVDVEPTLPPESSPPEPRPSAAPVEPVLPETQPLPALPPVPDDDELVVEPEDTLVQPALTLPTVGAAERRRPAPAPTTAAAPPPAAPPPRAPPPRAPTVQPRAEALVPIHRPLHYPSEARRLRLSGRVRVEAWIDARGTVTGVRLATSSGHSILDDAALRSARQWRFRPPGRPRRAYIPFRFVP